MWARRGGVVALVAVGTLVAACDDSTSPDIDRDEQRAYIDQIVQHHQIATMRADEALAKANRQGLRNIAQRMKEDQNREIAQFKAIRLNITGSDTTPPPMMPQPIPAGPEFERQWLTMMINHHQGAIDQSLLVHGAGAGGMLDSLAHHTIEEQQREQEEFRDSLRVWYT